MDGTTAVRYVMRNVMKVFDADHCAEYGLGSTVTCVDEPLREEAAGPAPVKVLVYDLALFRFWSSLTD